ncbi:MAG: hypothetical protein JSV17_13390 [Candidatus Aminicenantes bacterium]|nr:MAG: hypothetical protein JSV17_13390 [Candidatus Aminicenantes bacterium]
MLNKRLFLALSLGLFAFALAVSSYAQSADEIGDLYEKLQWRCVGPAVMGGRTVDIDVVEKKPWIIYAAIGPSGVWKSMNNGISWKPVFHKENTVSVGDIAISQSHPHIVWVGTGEATCRNSVTIGDGVYKSTDSGKTWANMGLVETRHIARIILNPGDPNIVYVAAMGHLWGSNEERGIYKTTNGGKSWKKILYVDENTGFADLAMDPSDSLTLFAAAYDYRRLPYHYRSGGPGSGLYKTTDGGETWKKLTKDLPEGIMGRIGIDVSRSNPNVVYALIEHEDAGIWRSEDKGESWTRTCDNETYERVNFRPFYYSQIRVDPSDDKVVYVFSGGSYVSKNMGEKFRAISAGTHPDHHALWIDPINPLHLIDGNDGGIDITYDGGKNWRGIEHMALAEVYQIGFDMRSPYYVYCGLQDNGVWGGPSAKFDSQGITNADWFVVGYGDGFYAQVDPNDHNVIYANSQMNGLYRYDMRIKKSQTIRPLAPVEAPPYRFNWNSPIHISPHDSKTVYTGGNFLFKTTDEGHSWEIISPDLSTNDPEKQKDSGGPITQDNTGAEIHCTIITISESPVKAGVIWCGTDDGNVQITQDGGQTWQNMAKNIIGLPPNTWCSRIEASHFKEGTAFAAFDGHRHDDYGTYLYKTSDYGKTWKSLKGNLPFGWIHVVREDPINRNLLYVGTEFGLYASLDRGKTWFPLQNNLPTVAVRDIAVHPRENDLIIGTHGRGIWILDDIQLLQEMNPQVLASDFHMFSIHPTTIYQISRSGELSSRPVYSGKNPDYGMILAVYMKNKPKEKPKVFIKNEEEEMVHELTLPTRKGILRYVWDLQVIPKTKDGRVVKPTGVGFIALPVVFPGIYSVEMTTDGQPITRTALINPDPRFSLGKEEYQAMVDFQVEIIVISKKHSMSVTAANRIRTELGKLDKALQDKKDFPEKVTNSIKEFKEKFERLADKIMPKGIGFKVPSKVALRGGYLSQQLIYLGMWASSYPSAPTEMMLAAAKETNDEVDALISQLNEFIRDDIPALNKILGANGLKPIKIPKEVSFSRP